MASSSLHLALILFLSLTITLSSADEAFIDSTCQNTKRSTPAFCELTLKSDNRSFTTPTTAGLVTIALDITLHHANATLLEINDAGKKNLGTPLGEALSLCSYQYNRARIELNKAIKLMASESYEDVALAVNATAVVPGKCDGVFAHVQMPPNIRGDNERSKALDALCTDLVDLFAPLDPPIPLFANEALS